MVARRGFRKLLPRQRKNATEYKRGHEKKAGRKKGVPNKITTSLKEAILQAVALAGSDGRGKNEVVGYLFKIATTEPGLMVRLLEKILPTQVTGEGGGAVKIMALPPEVLSKLPDNELAAMEAVYDRLKSGKFAVGNGKLGDADAYAASLNGSGTKH